MRVSEDAREVMRLFGRGDRPGPLMLVLMRECHAPAYYGCSPATRRAAERRDGTRAEPQTTDREIRDELVAANRRRWERAVERRKAEQLEKERRDG